MTLLVLPYHGNRASKSAGPGSLLSTCQPATFYLRTFSETSPSSVLYFLFDVFVVMSCLFFCLPESYPHGHSHCYMALTFSLMA